MTDTRDRRTRDPATRRHDAPEAIWPADPGALDAADRTGGLAPARQTVAASAGRSTARPSSTPCSISTARATCARARTRSPSGPGISPRSLFRYFEDADDLAGEAVSPPARPGHAAPAPRRGRRRRRSATGSRRWSTRGSACSRPSARPPTCHGCGPRSNPAWPRACARDAGSCAARSAPSSPPSWRRCPTTRPRRRWPRADVLASFESYQLLTGDQGLSLAEAKSSWSPA